MKKDLLPKRMAKTTRLRSKSAQTRAVQLERAEGLTARLRPKDPVRGWARNGFRHRQSHCKRWRLLYGIGFRRHLVQILSKAAPRYPRAARSIGFNKVVRVRVKFLAGLDGQVETTEIFTRNIPDLGFKEAAVEAVKKMKFAPIYHQGRNVKVY